MPKQQTDHLFQLIKSLSKSEKRNFKVYVNRIGSAHTSKFIMLFDILDKADEYNEEIILKKADSIKPAQLSNLKAHLYKQLLISLRLINLNNDIDIGIREQIDYAKVLYNKGLFRQSLRILEKVKNTAIKHKRNSLHYEIIEFEKLIELQYITRSIETRAEELTNESENISSILSSTGRYSNLALKLYGLYLKVGYVRNRKDMLMVKKFFDSNFKHPDLNRCSFYEKLYIFQSYVWYNYIIQDFLTCYKYAYKWVDLFHSDRNMIYIQTDMYLKGLNNLLGALFMIRHHRRFSDTLNALEDLTKDRNIHLNDNTSMLLYLFIYMNRINEHFLYGTFTKGLDIVPRVESYLKKYSRNIDNHRILVFYYKIACLYFSSGDHRTAIKYLNRIINFKDIHLREDIHCFARILNLISHFELGNEELIEYQVRSTYRFLAKMDDLHLVQKYILLFLRRLSDIEPDDLIQEFKKLHKKFIALADDPFEKRPFLYLDIISWLESKIQNRPVQEIIREKAKAEYNK